MGDGVGVSIKKRAGDKSPTLIWSEVGIVPLFGGGVNS